MGSDDVIFLLGAGASRDAGLKDSNQMTEELERKLTGSWRKYQKLYNAVKAGIVYGHTRHDGIVPASINIEELVNVLTELARCKEHPIYPFIASWNMELMETAGKDFELITEFRKKIISILVNEWINLQDPVSAGYYKGLQRFSDKFGSGVCVFSLNYDMCIERACDKDSVFTGFLRESGHEGLVWNEDAMKQNVDQGIKLFKLHGSVNWREQKDGRLVSYDSPRPCEDANEYRLIFGTENKLRYSEPYIFLLSAFREMAYRAKLIVCLGYSFHDSHINSLLSHAFRNQSPTRLLSVSWADERYRSKDEETEKERIAMTLKVAPESVSVTMSGAKAFLEDEQSPERLMELMPTDDPLF